MASKAQPFNIDGNVPDAGTDILYFPDISGSIKELGPENSNTTKVGVINSDVPPTLGLTNPNAQVDFSDVWLGYRTDPGTGDIWLYFAWTRDSGTGSGFISLEVQHDPAPLACDYEGASEVDLIANCNPWAGRQAGDFIIDWDQQGNSHDISMRTFDGTSFGPGVDLSGVGYAEAEYEDTVEGKKIYKYSGEVQVNLSATVLEEGVCTNLANFLPNTVTGNSDTADYKDTVLLTGLRIANCGTVIIRKQTDPDGTTGSFSFTNDLVDDGSNTTGSSFDLADDGVEIFINIFQTGSTNPVTPAAYMVREANPELDGFDLIDIDCSASTVPGNVTTDVDAGTAVFSLAALETVDCTYTNQARGTIIVEKQTIPEGTGRSFAFSGDAAGSIGDNEQITVSDLVPGTYTSTEALPGNPPVDPAVESWTLDSVVCDDGGSITPSSGDVGAFMATFKLDPGETVKCTFTNSVTYPAPGTVVIIKETVGGVGNFAYTTTSEATYGSGLPTNFNLGTTSANPNQVQFQVGTKLDAPTAYTVSETVPTTGWDLTGLVCVDDTSSDSSVSGNTATINVDSGETVTCTFTNTARGAIEVSKTRKHAGLGGSVAHPGVDFTISGGGLTSPVTVTTDSNGKACYDELKPGTYTVTESVPASYAGQAPKDVVVSIGSSCGDGNEAKVGFLNTPLTNVSVSAATQDASDGGATHTQISCSWGDSTSNVANPGITKLGLSPGTYTCTIVIDP